jgi:cell division protein FtsI/penicillin-binding protein 2
LTVAAGIDTGVISETTECDSCAGPRTIGKYTLRTWNDQYTPNITMEDALAKSDNTAMIFIAEKLGADRFQEYLKKFGIGQSTQVELQEDTTPPFPSKWGPVELATISFGQGISTNTLQIVKAVSAIANKGVLVKPRLIEKVIDSSQGEELEVKTQELGQVIKPETAERVTRMMVYAAQHGEAQWIVSKTHEVAGKTGTSQVAEAGQYLEDKTIASFIGFSPPDNPKFIMMVKLVAPQSSPWAAETAAPLWYKIADRLYLLFNMPADIHPQALVE